MEMDIKKEGSFFMRDAYKEEKKKYGVRYLSTAKRLSKEEIASMSKKEIKAEMDAADRKRAMCKESSPDNKMLLSNSVDLVLENSYRMIYGVCGFFIDLKGRDYERYSIRFQDVPEFDDCVSLESLFDECVQIVSDSGLSIDYSRIRSVYCDKTNKNTLGACVSKRFVRKKNKRYDIVIDERLLSRDVSPIVGRSVFVHELLHMLAGNGHGLRYVGLARKVMAAHPEIHIFDIASTPEYTPELQARMEEGGLPESKI